jgi:hypothetical protein
MDDQTDTEREETGGHISFDERIDPGKRCGHTGFRLVITDPAETAPIIEPGRAFAVEGRIEATYNSGLFSESDNEEGRISSENMNHTSPVLPSDTILVVELVSTDSENLVDNPNESYSEISQTGSATRSRHARTIVMSWHIIRALHAMMKNSTRAARR